MKKRHARLLIGILSLILIFAVGCAPKTNISNQSEKQEATKQTELKMAHFMSPKHAQHVEVMEPFAKEVEKISEGRVKISIFPGGALVKATEQYNAAVTGIADISFGLHGYTPGKFPLTSVVQLPFIASSAQSGSSILWEYYKKFPQVEAEYKDIKVMWLWTSDPGQIITTKKEVRTLEDMKGLKLRSPAPELNAAIEAWGATPVSMPMNELFDSLQKGVVDGALAPLSSIKDFNLQDVAKYVTQGDFYVSGFFMVANPTSWQGITPQDQSKIQALIGKPMSEKAAKVYDKAAQEGLKLAESKGVTVYTLPSEELDRWKKAVESLNQGWVKNMTAKGYQAQDMVDEITRLGKQFN